jgi:hypothetical protein
MPRDNSNEQKQTADHSRRVRYKIKQYHRTEHPSGGMFCFLFLFFLESNPLLPRYAGIRGLLTQGDVLGAGQILGLFIEGR